MLRRLGWIAATLTLGVLLSSVFRSTNVTVSLVTLILCALALARPEDVLLVAIAFAGLGNILRVLAGISTLRVEEIIVAAALFGWCVRSAVDRADARPPRAGVPVLPVMLLGLTVACSAAVWMRVDQVWTTYLSSYLGELWRWVATQYFVDSSRFADVVSTMAVLESLALCLAVASVCHGDRTFLTRALRMLIVGGGAVGALSVFRVVEITIRNPNSIAILRAGAGLRISPQISDYIAAAAYFGLCWTAALGFVLQRTRERVLMIAAAILLAAGLFLTGSRSAVGAAAAGILVLAYLVARRKNATYTRAVIGVAVIALVGFALVFARLVGHDLTGATAAESLKVRFEIVRAGISVFETHPIFGVGLDRFFLYLRPFASPQLRAYGRLNPHNDFLRMAVEFGSIGLCLFLWILLDCAHRIGAYWNGEDPPLAGLVGGLTAFLITMLSSNPLMVHSISYVFWMALGLATGGATAGRENVTASDKMASQRGWRRTALISVCSAAIVTSIPFRANREIAATDLAGVTYGLYDWTTSPAGVPTRLSGANATLFVSADAQMVEIPLTGTSPTGRDQRVSAFLDGRLANELMVGREPQQLRIVLPNHVAHARRIDLDVSPTWIPADVEGAGDDHRTIGVRVGKVIVLRATSGGG
jgi:O-antigen ligase